MTSSRPYLVRAIYEWIVDNGLTPHLLVDTSGEEAQVPREYIQEGRIILNVDPTAVVGLDIANDFIGFSARFGGTPRQIIVPVHCVLAIYARENGQGMMFTEEDQPPPPMPDKGDEALSVTPRRPNLKVVK